MSGLNSDGGKDRRKVNNMSNYNNLAQELDRAYKAARDEYAAGYQKMQLAKETLTDKKAAFKNGKASELDVNRATLAAKEAETEFNEISARVWKDFKRHRDDLRDNLERNITANTTARPEDVDSNALELMKSGVLTPSDYVAFANKYDGNQTMLNLIGRYAKEAADATTGADATTLRGVVVACQNPKTAILQKWDDIAEAQNRFCGDRDNVTPQTVISMGEQWDEILGDAIASF